MIQMQIRCCRTFCHSDSNFRQTYRWLNGLFQVLEQVWLGDNLGKYGMVRSQKDSSVKAKTVIKIR